MICLDTTFIIDMLKRKPECINKLNLLIGEELATTEVNYFEILFGIFKRHDSSKKELDLINEFFETINVLPLDHLSSLKAAQVAGNLSKQGLLIGTNDSLIAGICLANNCRIITRDTEHFLRIKGLKVERY